MGATNIKRKTELMHDLIKMEYKHPPLKSKQSSMELIRKVYETKITMEELMMFCVIQSFLEEYLALIDNMGRPALIDSHRDDEYLMEAYSWAAYTRNRMSVRRHNKHVASGPAIAATPYEMIKGHAPSVKHMLPFGCTVYVNAPARKRGKAVPWAHHSEPGILLGYANPFDRHYRIELLNEQRSIITSMHVDADLENFGYLHDYIDNPRVCVDVLHEAGVPMDHMLPTIEANHDAPTLSLPSPTPMSEDEAYVDIESLHLSQVDLADPHSPASPTPRRLPEQHSLQSRAIEAR